MEAFDLTFERVPEVRGVVTVLVFSAILLAGWFPGHNARHWGHGSTWLVQRVGWLWSTLAVSASVGGLIDWAWPALLLMWVGIIAWSYGRSLTPATAPQRVGNGFEVLIEPVDGEDEIPTAAVAS